MNILIDSVLIYIKSRKMCLSKKILYQYFVIFCPVWESFSSQNILYAIT